MFAYCDARLSMRDSVCAYSQASTCERIYDTHTPRCAGVYTIMVEFFPSKRRASDPYMVTVRRLAYALQRVTHPTCSPVATRSPSVLLSCLYLLYQVRNTYICIWVGVYYAGESRIDFSPNQLQVIRVGLGHTHHLAKGGGNTCTSIDEIIEYCTNEKRKLKMLLV
ncbi:uncharacterized protein LOC117155825 [Bombus vancouverensis nearcticus]|uniref:uncharacterized protein LOC117155825 n=1 Tax=Bombus vancouverensis nearcticus TaxID=2705178 RepID=UPI00402BCE2C